MRLPAPDVLIVLLASRRRLRRGQRGQRREHRRTSRTSPIRTCTPRTRPTRAPTSSSSTLTVARGRRAGPTPAEPGAPSAPGTPSAAGARPPRRRPGPGDLARPAQAPSAAARRRACRKRASAAKRGTRSRARSSAGAARPLAASVDAAPASPAAADLLLRRLLRRRPADHRRHRPGQQPSSSRPGTAASRQGDVQVFRRADLGGRWFVTFTADDGYDVHEDSAVRQGPARQGLRDRPGRRWHLHRRRHRPVPPAGRVVRRASAQGSHNMTVHPSGQVPLQLQLGPDHARVLPGGRDHRHLRHRRAGAGRRATTC